MFQNIMTVVICSICETNQYNPNLLMTIGFQPTSQILPVALDATNISLDIVDTHPTLYFYKHLQFAQSQASSMSIIVVVKCFDLLDFQNHLFYILQMGLRCEWLGPFPFCA